METGTTKPGFRPSRRAMFLATAGSLLGGLSPHVLAAEPSGGGAVQAQRRKHVYIIHGYMAKPSDHWFPWLKKRLMASGFDADVLPMPQSDRPRARAWDRFLGQRIARHDEDTFFVAHSLGCISLLRHLDERQDRVGGVVLVSGFSEPLPGLPQLDEFALCQGKLGSIGALAGRRTVIAARDDGIVPYAATQRLAGHLDARLVTVDRGGHFLGSDGFREFPLAYDELISVARPRS